MTKHLLVNVDDGAHDHEVQSVALAPPGQLTPTQ